MFARFFVLLVCLGFFPALQAQAVNCAVSAGFKQIGITSGESPIYPVDPTCYNEIDAKFYSYPAPPKTPWNKFAVINSCVVIQDAQATTGGWFLKQILDYQFSNNRVAALKQFFGQVVYEANNQLLNNNLQKYNNAQGAQYIIPACKQKDNQFAGLTFWFNVKTGVLKINFDLAVPLYYASRVNKALASASTIQSGIKAVFTSAWLTKALREAGSHTTSSCFVDAMQQIGLANAPTVSCGLTMTKADEAKEVQAETAERKLRGAAATEAEEAERKLQAKGPIKIQSKGALKVLGGGSPGTAKTTLGGR